MNDINLAQRFCTAMQMFADDPATVDELCMLYVQSVVGILWNPSGEGDHIVLFDDGSGVHFDVQGALKAGRFEVVEKEDEEDEEDDRDCMAARHTEAIMRTRPLSTERRRASDAMHNDVLKIFGSMEHGAALYIMKDLSSIAAVREQGSINVIPATAARTIRKIVEVMARR